MRASLKWVGMLMVVTLSGLIASVAQREVDDALSAQSSDGVHVLFIGNSFTYYEDMPRMLRKLAQAGQQPPLIYEMEAPGGCTLEKHWRDGKARSKIRSRRWNYVVLQEQSQIPMTKPALMLEYGKMFDEEIKKQDASTLLYSTFAMKDKINDQPAISGAYRMLANLIDCPIAPVGNAWEVALRIDDKLVLHNADKLHPNSTGAYLTACVFYASIYGKSPEGLPGSIGNLSNENALILQHIAWRVVQDLDE